MSLFIAVVCSLGLGGQLAFTADVSPEQKKLVKAVSWDDVSYRVALSDISQNETEATIFIDDSGKRRETKASCSVSKHWF